MKKEFKYKLVEPISVDVGGKSKQCRDVIVHAPRPIDMADNFDIEQILRAASTSSARETVAFMKKITDEGIDLDKLFKKEKKKATEKEGEEISDTYNEDAKEIFQNIKRKDFPDLRSALRRVMTGGEDSKPNATIGGVRFTELLFDSIGLADFKGICTRYFVDFL